MILSAAPNNRRYPLWRSYLNSSRLLVILVGALDNCHVRTLDSWYQELLAPWFEFGTLVQWNHWWHRIKPQTMDAITGKRSYLNSIKSHSHPHTQKCAWWSHFSIIMCEVILRWFKDQWNQIMYLINIQCWDDSGKRSLEIFWLGRHFPITLGGHLFVTCENHLQKTFY